MCPYVSRKHSYVTCVSLYVTRMYWYGFICHSYVIVCTRMYPYVTRTLYFNPCVLSYTPAYPCLPLYTLAYS